MMNNLVYFAHIKVNLSDRCLEIKLLSQKVSSVILTDIAKLTSVNVARDAVMVKTDIIFALVWVLLLSGKDQQVNR